MSRNLSIILALVLVLQQTLSAESGVKTEVFLSPEIVLEPGLVSNKNYYNIEFPRSHIALKSFNAELVDAAGNPVPLYGTYLHHWVLQRYLAPKNNGLGGHFNYTLLRNIKLVDVGQTLTRNNGVCENGLVYYYGVGAETRRTSTEIPDPYGIHVGDPAAVPAGYEEGWMLIVHAIDTRGVEDVMGCTECRCNLYDVDGETLPAGYKGGLECCNDENRCRLKEGFRGEERKLYLRYTVKYVDWDPLTILPLRIYVLDVTDDWTRTRGIVGRHHCGIEYDVEECDVGVDKNGCVDTRSLSVSLPAGGDVVYGVGHQHSGGTGMTLYGEGGRTICSSKPRYGEGIEAANEAGFIVGMSTCYPSPAGAVRISAGEKLTLVSNYSSDRNYIGVMGLFYLLLADSPPKPPSLTYEITKVPNFVWPIVLLGAMLVIVAALAWKGRTGKEEGYEAML